MSSLQALWKFISHAFWWVAHEWLYDLSWFVGPVLMWLVADYKIEYRGRVPTKGGVIVTANHLSQWDLVSVNNVVPRPYYQMAKVEFFEVFFVGGMVRLQGAFPINRGKADRQSLNYAVDLLKKGEVLCIFPEGHRSDNYKLGEAYGGAALLAKMAGVPIIPVAIIGTQNISRDKRWKEGKPGPFFRRRPPVKAIVGQAYLLPQPAPGEKEGLDAQTDFIMSKIAELLPPEYQGEYSPVKLSERQAQRAQTKAQRAARKAARQPTVKPEEVA